MPKSRTRLQLQAYLTRLGLPHIKGPGEFYIQHVLHDDWCGLSKPTATLHTKCRCNPTVTLERMGASGEVVESIPLLEDGREVVHGN